MKAITLAVLAIAVSLSASPKDDDPILTSFVTSGEFAYFVAPPRPIADGDHIGVYFTPDGRYGLIGGVEPPMTSAEELLKSMFDPSRSPAPKTWMKMWDTENNSVRDASQAIVNMFSKSSQGMRSGWEWTAKSGVAITALGLTDNSNQPVAYAVTTAAGGAKRLPTKAGVFRVSFAEGTVTQLLTLSTSDASVQILASPVRPVFAIVTSQMNRPLDRADIKSMLKFQLYDLNGKLLKSGESEVKGMAGFDEWTTNGSDLLGHVARRASPGTKPSMSRLVLNLTTGVVSETKEDIKAYSQPDANPPLVERMAYSEVKQGETTRRVPTLWLASATPSEEPECMVAAGVEKFHWLSPRMNLVSYTANGRLMASEIVKMDIEEFHKLKAAALQRDAMSNAKQVAVAMQIYAADADDYMPLSDSYMDSVEPYLKNRDVMNGFVYTYKGGSLADLKDPAGTEIGYISVNGGRAVAYADGHVKFVKGP